MADQPPVPLPAIGFIGAGRAAAAIAPALEAAGCHVVAVASRTLASAERVAASLKSCKTGTPQEVAGAADLVFITTSDSAVAEVAGRVDWRSGGAAVHCSGALTLEPLAKARADGAQVGSWHPVQTFTGAVSVPEDRYVLRGVTIGIEASGALLETLRGLARRVGAVPLDVPAAARPLYHAAAVMSCGYLVTLLHEAAALWERAGLPREAALPALAGLAEATLTNVRASGTRASLTGPAARGDVATVRAHLAALRDAAPEAEPLYRLLAERSVALAGGGPEWETVFEPSKARATDNPCGN